MLFDVVHRMHMISSTATETRKSKDSTGRDDPQVQETASGDPDS